MSSLLRLVSLLILPGFLLAQSDIPAVYSKLESDTSGYFMGIDTLRVPEVPIPAQYRLGQFRDAILGTPVGLAFDFENIDGGTLYYGLIPFGDSKHPQPVFFKKTVPIREGIAAINIKTQLAGLYDMTGWQDSGRGTLGYRVVNAQGLILYDGVVGFRGTGPFKVDTTVIEGPLLSQPMPDGCTISFLTNDSIVAVVEVDGQTFSSPAPTTHHEIRVHGLDPARTYPYILRYGERSQAYTLRTALPAGSRESFTFAYASDSRNGQGGGERNIYGTNAYIMKKIMALATQQGAAFMQFTGDLINGYLTEAEEMDLQYANWKRAITPWAHHLPVYVGMGNHESLMRTFRDDRGFIAIDRFPFTSESAEAVFARHFAMPDNGPVSEDGASYDPDPSQIDFPPYRENAYHYRYGNVAVVVLNSDYFYAPSTETIPLSSGGLHGYIMDVQLDWLQEVITELERDETIDHIFVTQHTPAFPNGGHVQDDMWYNGNNDFRPFVAGKPLKQGIIERRDQYLDILINQSRKVVALLTGDEHNYGRTKIGPDTPIYPEGWKKKRMKLKRTIWQINNGAAGAPYYAQETTPWSDWVEGFTTQNALVLIKVTGDLVEMEVRNPDTLEHIDQLRLR